MTVEENGNGVANDLPSHSISTPSRKGLFSSLREKGDDVLSTPEGSSKGKTGSSFFPSPRNNCRSPVPLTPVPAVLNLNVGPLKNNISKLLTPSRTFSRLRDERDEISRLTPTPCTQTCFKDTINLPLVGEVRLDQVAAACKQWLRNPKNLALLFWGLAVGISGALLFMVMVGMLDSAIPQRSKRDTLFEVSNQILNALFTLMCVYLHPQRCFHLHMLIRWKPADILKLREFYCKNGTRKPNEWAHMLVVVLLLQLNCWAQYALCGLNWGYRRSDRPAIGVALCLCLSMGAAAGAGIYNTLSPLGKEYDLDSDGSDGDDVEKASLEPKRHKPKEFAARNRLYRMLERRLSFADRQGTCVENPEWRGGLFDCAQDKPIAILSTVCCPCVFGWNMDRLGFGNRYVHIVTFALLCTAPFWIFDLAAINIENRVVRHSIGSAGIVLCAFGLLYGGFWRIRMRERYKLPANNCCCGYPNIADCAQWMFCPLCSLCQEVRTAEHYEVRDDKFYTRGHREVASPLPVSPPHSLPLTPRSPPNGFHFVNTPAATIPGVKEMPPTGTKGGGNEIELLEVSTNPFLSPGESTPNGISPHSTNPFLTPEILATFSPMAPPPAVTASRNSSNSGDRVAKASGSPRFPPALVSSFASSISPGEEAGSLTKPNCPSVHSDQDVSISPALSMEANGNSSSHKELAVFPVVQDSLALRNDQAPVTTPPSPNRMFLHTEEGAYVYPPKLNSSFLQTDGVYEDRSDYQGSPKRFVSEAEDDMKQMSPNNPFLESNVVAIGNSPVSVNTEYTGVSSQMQIDEIHQRSPRRASVDDNGIKMSLSNPFMESSSLSANPEHTGISSFLQIDETHQGSPRRASVDDNVIKMSPSNPFLEPKMVAEGNSPPSSMKEILGKPSALLVEDSSNGGEQRLG